MNSSLRNLYNAYKFVTLTLLYHAINIQIVHLVSHFTISNETLFLTSMPDFFNIRRYQKVHHIEIYPIAFSLA